MISFFFVDWLLGIIGTSGVGQRTSDRKNKRVKLRKVFVSSAGNKFIVSVVP